MAAQAQKHVTHNESLRMLDALIHLTVLAIQSGAPPEAPAEGDAYIIDSGALGDWENLTDSIAVFQDGAWSYHIPGEGWRAWVVSKARLYVFSGGGWKEQVTQIGLTGSGGFTRLHAVEEDLDLAGSQTTAVTQIPDRSIVLGVSVRVTATIGGASAFEVGVDGDTSKFGSQLGIEVASTNVGVVGPTAYYADTPIIITPIGGSFSSGTVRLVLHTIECGPPLA